MKLFWVFIFCLLSIYQNSSGQNYLLRFGGIPVTINGINCVSPFNGGIDQPRYQFIDIDGDGKLDLFIFDRDTSLNFYRNIGTVNSPLFELDSIKYLNLPIKNWFVFVDINHTGLIDLFTGGNANTIRYFRNAGTLANPNYVLQIDPLKTSTDSTMFSEAACVPTFADIDGNNTLDFFTGNSIGTVSYYKNIGTPQNFSFQFVTGTFAGISIIGGGNTSGIVPKNFSENDLHGASSIRFADITNTGKLDLFWGDFFGHSIYYIKNTGTPQSFAWNLIDTNNPKPNPWFSAGFNMPGLYDIDGDGKKDWFVGVLNGSQTKDNFAYFKNIGPDANPQFTLMTKNFIPCIDVGSNSYPSFCDINNDGAPDLFIGGSNATVAYYKNTGTPFNPAYTLVTDSLPIISTSFNYAPAFGDLDGDGKKDMIVGSYDGKLRYFKNTGTLQNPVFTYTASQLDAISVAQSCAPALADLNGDGKLDLLIGDSGGHIAYYINDGSPTAFHFTLVSSTFQNIFVGNDSAPTLADIDHDGDLDMLIGNRLGKIYYYRNDGSASNPNFVLVSNNYANINVTLYCVPALTDVNNDGDIDLFVGSIKGGLFYYENRDVIGISNINSQVPERYKLYQNYPNPFNPETKIKFDLPSVRAYGNTPLQLIVYDALGKEAAVLVNEQFQPGTYEVDWNASNFPSGVYFYKLESENFIETKKMVLIK